MKVPEIVIAWFIGISLLALIATSIAWKVYCFKDCKKVGHSTLYCVGRIGK